MEDFEDTLGNQHAKSNLGAAVLDQAQRPIPIAGAQKMSLYTYQHLAATCNPMAQSHFRLGLVNHGALRVQ